jgi:hypothetical protein
MSSNETPKLLNYIYYPSNSTKKEAIKSVKAYTVHEATEYFASVKDLSYGDFLAIYTVIEK